MKVIILIGLPGSGKSTYAKALSGNNKIVSSDHYFTDERGNYNWSPDTAHLGHENCLRTFIAEALEQRYDNLIVDNTNLKMTDVAPYVRIAQAYELDVEVKLFDVGTELAKQRNVHRVPDYVIDAMARALYVLRENWPLDFPDIDFISR